jgi:hypothetical protein
LAFGMGVFQRTSGDAPLLFEAMATIDAVSGRSRGFVAIAM